MSHYGDLPKLVRDKIPEIAEKNNDGPEVERLSDEEVKDYVTRKICEEAEELRESKGKEELADLLEAIDKYRKLEDIDMSEIDGLRREKNEKRGGFEENLILISTGREK